MEPTTVVSRLLQNTAHPSILSSLCTPDCTFVSITYNNPPLKAVLPFAGRHVGEGPQAILDTFSTVDAIWKRDEFTVDTIFQGKNVVKEGADVFGSSNFAETHPKHESVAKLIDVSVFGSFALKSRTTGKKIRSPYCVWCKVNAESEKVVYMQYLEDTLGTTSVLKSQDGYGKFHVFAEKGEFDV